MKKPMQKSKSPIGQAKQFLLIMFEAIVPLLMLGAAVLIISLTDYILSDAMLVSGYKLTVASAQSAFPGAEIREIGGCLQSTLVFAAMRGDRTLGFIAAVPVSYTGGKSFAVAAVDMWGDTLLEFAYAPLGTDEKQALTRARGIALLYAEGSEMNGNP